MLSNSPTPPATSRWPLSYGGRGIWIEQLSDGCFIGIAEGGYQSRSYPTSQDALADITAWIATQVPFGGEVSA